MYSTGKIHKKSSLKCGLHIRREKGIKEGGRKGGKKEGRMRGSEEGREEGRKEGRGRTERMKDGRKE